MVFLFDYLQYSPDNTRKSVRIFRNSSERIAKKTPISTGYIGIRRARANNNAENCKYPEPEINH
uniref:Uncharacterized protein n=1 Tax=Cucumis melo TaxID=3656 RepID=A0A9I9DNH1_CUCME